MQLNQQSFNLGLPTRIDPAIDDEQTIIPPIPGHHQKGVSGVNSMPLNERSSDKYHLENVTKMSNKQSRKAEISSAEAVFLGALAPGVNGSTWTTLKSTFVMPGVSLAVMLGLAFSSSDTTLMLHVGFLVLIAVSLFMLLSWFLAETGLVSVEHQMQEMDMVPNDQQRSKKSG
ncbi:hypothetical protein ACOSQ2_012322 [Xanthoceras sorbifolium]